MGWTEVVTTYVVAVGDLCVLWAMSEGATLCELCAVKIWSTLFSHQMTVFSKEPMENGPASITALIHVVAVQEELRR
jgi:hypothetical protein